MGIYIKINKIVANASFLHCPFPCNIMACRNRDDDVLTSDKQTKQNKKGKQTVDNHESGMFGFSNNI